MLEEVRIAAALAKIDLSEYELSRYAGEFEKAFSEMEALKTAGVTCEPLVHGIEGIPCKLRADEHAGDFDKTALLANAPDVQDDCFAVPRILE